MPMCVIDLLEIVQIDKQQTQSFSQFVGSSDRLLEAVIEKGAIGQRRQGIMVCPVVQQFGLLLKFFLNLFLVGNVLRKTGQPESMTLCIPKNREGKLRIDDGAVFGFFTDFPLCKSLCKSLFLPL